MYFPWFDFGQRDLQTTVALHRSSMTSGHVSAATKHIVLITSLYTVENHLISISEHHTKTNDTNVDDYKCCKLKRGTLIRISHKSCN